jgi:hypothetical protein
VERACGFDRSQLYSDEAPPIGSIGIESWTEVAFPVIVLVVAMELKRVQRTP